MMNFADWFTTNTSTSLDVVWKCSEKDNGKEGSKIEQIELFFYPNYVKFINQFCHLHISTSENSVHNPHIFV